MASGWPLDGPKYNSFGELNPSFTPSNIDIPIRKNENHLYVVKLKDGLERLRKYVKPDIAIVLSAADPYEEDELESTAELRLNLNQMRERDVLVYNFLNKEAGEKILEVCKKNNVGTSAMKTAPGVIKAEIFDPDNPSKDAEDYIERVAKRGVSRAEAIKRIERWSKGQQEDEIKTKPFLEKSV